MTEEERRRATALYSVGSFFLGLEHVACDFCDEAAGNKAFAESAEIISEAGDNIALAGSEGSQSGVCHFFGGFGIALEFFLTRNGVEFGFGRAWAKSTDADSVGFHLFGKAFGEEQIEGFRGGVSRDIRNGLEGSGGSENKDIAAAARNHFRQVQTGQVDHRMAVHLDHVEQTLFFNRGKFAVLAETGVVDQ